MAKSTKKTVEEKTFDSASQEIVEAAERDSIQLAWDRYEM